MEEIKVVGMLFKHGEDDYSLWEGFTLTKEDEDAIANIISKYDTQGCSIRGTYEQITKQND